LHKDHIGSVEAMTDTAGNLVDRMSFDPWGMRQQTNWNTGNPTGGDPAHYPTTRGYTGHEMLDQVNLIHMNGRVYDPVIGRFLSPDLFVQAPFNTQSFNRYSYVWNNPLSLVDPSGYFCGPSGGTAYNMMLGQMGAVADASSIRVGDPGWINMAFFGTLGSWSPSGAGPLGNGDDSIANSNGPFMDWAFETTGQRGSVILEDLDEKGNVIGQTEYEVPVTGRSAFRGMSSQAGAIDNPYAGSRDSSLSGLNLFGRRLLGWLGLTAVTQKVAEENAYLRHYTTILNAEKIMERQLLVPSPDGYVYLTPDIYDSGQQAQSSLSMSTTPEGFFWVPIRNFDTYFGPSIVPPANGFPGGGIEIRVPHPINTPGFRWELIGP
jgi:RHS repeat-associated protein